MGSIGTLSLTYGTPNTTYDGYNAVPSFVGGGNFALGAGNSITIKAIGFDLATADFEIWDLDTAPNKPTEKATFNDGTQLTGVSTNIDNAQAHTNGNPVFALSVTPNGIGEITLTASPDGAAAFAIGGIKVSAVPLPAALPLLTAALGLIGFVGTRRRRASKGVALAA